MIMSLKQTKRKFEPRIKLNHNIYIINYKKVQLAVHIFWVSVDRDYHLITDAIQESLLFCTPK